jgi:putative aldouronate transport system substrate-binding protein
VTGGAVDLYFGNSPDTYVPFEVCSGPEGVQWQTASRSDAGIRTAISADCEHPEIAFMLTQYVYYNKDTLEWFYIHRWGEQNVDWRFAKEGEEGMFSAFGYKPNLLQLQNTWGVMTNKHWQGTELMNNVCYAPEIMEVFAGSTNNDEYQYAQNYGLNKGHAPAFSDLLPALNYTQEETDQWTDARTALKTFVRESRVQFAMGQKDPSSDADWEQYLNELNVLKYKDILAVDQAAYERMFGAK